MMLKLKSLSPARMAVSMGEAPRYAGSRKDGGREFLQA